MSAPEVRIGSLRPEDLDALADFWREMASDPRAYLGPSGQRANPEALQEAGFDYKNYGYAPQPEGYALPDCLS